MTDPIEASASPASRTRAIVFGGGGPVGVAWELGLAAGLSDSGIDLSVADRVVGTSAGSIAGALLLGGDDLSGLINDVESMFASGTSASGAGQVSADALAEFMEMTLDSGSIGEDASARSANMKKVGQFALAAQTIAEDAFVDSIGSVLGGRPWPSGFSCTAVDASTGELRVWDEGTGVPLERAVASSCSVPGVYPPITISGSRYMDGGARSPLNADLAEGYDTAIVVSVTVLELPPGIEDPRIGAFLAGQRDQVEALRTSGVDVAVIVPDMEFLMLSGFGMSLMDFSLVGAAAEAGVRLGKAEAERIREAW